MTSISLTWKKKLCLSSELKKAQKFQIQIFQADIYFEDYVCVAAFLEDALLCKHRFRGLQI